MPGLVANIQITDLHTRRLVERIRRSRRDVTAAATARSLIRERAAQLLDEAKVSGEVGKDRNASAAT